MRKRRSWALGAAVLTCLAVASERGAPAQPTEGPRVDPRADQLLHRMSDYLGGLRSFGVVADHATEVVLQNGQKLELSGRSRVLVERPNRLRSDRVGPIADLSFYYDGRTMGVLGHKNNLYAMTPAPATLDAAIDFGREVLDLEAPAADLLYSDPYHTLMEDAVSGAYIGVEPINGTACHHLAYRGNETDFQIWIEDGPRPLPCKYVIVSKHVASLPEFTVELHDWQVAMSIADDVFELVPPPGAERIDFMRAPARRGGER